MFTENLENLIQKKNGIFSTAEALSAGVSKAYLGKLVRHGSLDRIAPGQYALPNTMIDDLYLYQKRCANIIYSHETALYLLDYAERTPFSYSLTVPSNAYIAADIIKECKVFYIKPDLYLLGRTNLPTKMGQFVWCYDLERTICDLIRSRSRIDDQIVTAAIKKFVTDKAANFDRLGHYADLLRVTKPLRRYTEILL